MPFGEVIESTFQKSIDRAKSLSGGVRCIDENPVEGFVFGGVGCWDNQDRTRGSV